jgi:hypothetical protein
MKRMLLALESCLTAVPFIMSWLICAIIFSAKAGYLMAAADAAKKAQILDALWPTPKFLTRWRAALPLQRDRLKARWAKAKQRLTKDE